MARILLDLDEAALVQASQLFGTESAQDTVNAALRMVAQQLKRAQALTRLAELGESGAFDELLDKDARRS